MSAASAPSDMQDNQTPHLQFHFDSTLRSGAEEVVVVDLGAATAALVPNEADLVGPLIERECTDAFALALFNRAEISQSNLVVPVPVPEYNGCSRA